MKFKNIKLAIEDQLPINRFIKNLLKGHVFGLLSKRSHLREDNKPKVTYNTKRSSLIAAEAMSKKMKVHFSSYKCLHCDGYHIGRNRENKKPKDPNNKIVSINNGWGTFSPFNIYVD